MPAFLISNDLHNTEAAVVPGRSGIVRPTQVQSVRKRLCNVEGCDCEGLLNERGPQTCKISVDSNGHVRVSSRK